MERRQSSSVSGAPSVKSDDFEQDPSNMAEVRSVSSGSVLCDVCSGSAVKRCLTCMASYCEVHVKDHHTYPDLDSHKLQDLHHHSLCPQHHKELEFYCRTDQAAICSRCLLHTHNGHDVIEQPPERMPSKSSMKQGSANVPPPGPIQFVSVQPDSVSLRWSPPEGVPDHRTFKVTTWTGSQKRRSFPVTSSTLEMTELTPGEEYHFTVATLSQDGRQSTPVEGAVYTEVPPPPYLQVSTYSATANVSWTEPAGVDQVTYLLEIIRDQEHMHSIHKHSCQYSISDLQNPADYTINVTTVLSNGRHSKPTSEIFRLGPPLRVVLTGITGWGKSASGNTILDWNAFESSDSPMSVTNTCDQQSTTSPREILVVDTPPLNLSKEDEIPHLCRDYTETNEEILDCIRWSDPGPHAFLLVIKVGLFSERYGNVVRVLQEIFGEKMKDHIIILFTHGDQLGGQAIEEYISRSHPKLQELISSCAGRYHVFNNKSRDRTQVVELVGKIDEMVAANGGQHFTDEKKH